MTERDLLNDDVPGGPPGYIFDPDDNHFGSTDDDGTPCIGEVTSEPEPDLDSIA
jgi:hypothetical protein